MLKVGDRVYHRNLERYGLVNSFDQFDDTCCFVEFDEDEYGVVDELCVSINWIEKVEGEE